MFFNSKASNRSWVISTLWYIIFIAKSCQGDETRSNRSMYTVFQCCQTMKNKNPDKIVFENNITEKISVKIHPLKKQLMGKKRQTDRLILRPQRPSDAGALGPRLVSHHYRHHPWNRLIHETKQDGGNISHFLVVCTRTELLLLKRNKGRSARHRCWRIGMFVKRYVIPPPPQKTPLRVSTYPTYYFQHTIKNNCCGRGLAHPDRRYRRRSARVTPRSDGQSFYGCRDRPDEPWPRACTPWTLGSPMAQQDHRIGLNLWKMTKIEP